MAISNNSGRRSDKEIFFEALEKATPDERAAFLDHTCAGDALLRQRVEELLANHFEQDNFMQEPAVDVAAASKPASPLSESPGTLIGRYKLLQKIGEGGMGVVYMAEQEEPVRRRVALKIIKLGMDTKQVVARFEAERQALALMDHPNIARVLDGGATETGRPYFVMELVQGVPITEFCDKNHLSTEQRLKLFIPVCQAVQSAHQKGIIHRDLKPTNILVTLNPDGSGFPKVIDFGVAKATSQKLTEKTLFTAYGMIVGTPSYMSPEQAEMSHLDVDTRSDIYSLGALLYELLTGTPPFSEHRLRSAGYNEMQRIILEEQPLKPSTRLSTLQGEQRSIVARNRGASELTLGRGFPGDLDWIVMKCLEKDRARRYETANGLAHDIERHLRNEPITARPPSRLYEFQKTLRRHWMGFAAVGAVVAALAIGVGVSTLEALRARRVEGLARQAQANEASQKAAAQETLYASLVAQARATRLARRLGYRDQVFALLAQAKALEVPEKNLADLRQEAVACLGDFVGLTPATLTNFSTNIASACLAPSGKLAAFVLHGCVIELRDLLSGAQVARFHLTNETFGSYQEMCFNSRGDQLFAQFGTQMPRRLYSWAPDVDGQWRQTDARPMPAGAQGFFKTETAVLACSFERLQATAPDRSQYVCRLSDLQTGAFVDGYAVTNDLPKGRHAIFVPSGNCRILARESWDNPSTAHVVDLYDWRTGAWLNQVKLGEYTRLGLADSGWTDLSDDGRHLSLTGGRGGTIYSIPGLERVTQFKEVLYGAHVRISGNVVALARQQQQRIQLWHLVQGENMALLDEPDEAWPQAFSADGNRLLTLGAHHARLYRLSTPEKLDLPPHGGAAEGLAVSPDGRYIASTGRDQIVRVCDAKTGRTVWETNDLPSLGSSVSFSPDGRWLAVGLYYSDLVWIRDAQTGKPLLELGSSAASQTTWSTRFSPDSRYLAAAGNYTNGVRIWAINRREDTEHGGMEAKLIASTGRGWHVMFASDSRSAAFSTPNLNKPYRLWSLYLWDFERSSEPRLVQGSFLALTQCRGLASDGDKLVALDTRGDIVTLDFATGRKISSFHVERPTQRMAVLKASPDASKLALTVNTPTGSAVSVLDSRSGKLLYSLPAENGTVYGLDWSPDSAHLAVSQDNGGVAIWDLETVNRILAQLGLSP